MSDFDYDDGECPICGGEGFVFECFDGCCLDADIGCDDCTVACECMRPNRQAPPELAQVLSDALEKIKAVAETDATAPGDTGLVSGVSSEQTSPEHSDEG